jgi:glycosyltransferase involved in cell wall biosynthesis
MVHVLQISPFAIPDAPDSGGLIRIAETRRAYERAGCEVSTCSLVTRRRDLRNPLDLQLNWLDRLWRQHLGKPSNLGPIRIRWATMRSKRLSVRLLSKVKKPVDVIHIEHPWAVRLAEDLRRHPLLRDALLVYGSHNIEHQLYRGLWEKTRQWNRSAQQLCAQIKQAEAECAARADICWAVSEQDAHTLRDTLQAKRVELAPSGCRALPERQVMPGLPERPYALFVGGAYPPNIDGFTEWCGLKLAYLPANTAVVVAGGAGDALAQMPTYQEDINRGALINFGRTPQALLDQLILHANAIILPISVGGGTNLKTAEALRSKRPLIATQASMRGFEVWIASEGVHLPRDAQGFRQSIVDRLNQALCQDCDRDHLIQLGWERCLEDAVTKTLALVADVRHT